MAPERKVDNRRKGSSSLQPISGHWSKWPHSKCVFLSSSNLSRRRRCGGVRGAARAAATIASARHRQDQSRIDPSLWMFCVCVLCNCSCARRKSCRISPNWKTLTKRHQYCSGICDAKHQLDMQGFWECVHGLRVGERGPLRSEPRGR